MLNKMTKKPKTPEAMQNYCDNNLKNLLEYFDQRMKEEGHVMLIILAGGIIDGASEITLFYGRNQGWRFVAEEEMKRLLSSDYVKPEWDDDISSYDLVFTKQITKEQLKTYKTIHDDVLAILDRLPISSVDRRTIWIEALLQEFVQGIRQQILSSSSKVHLFPKLKGK